MTYRFKINQEAVWFVLVAAGTVILQALTTLDVDKVTDWRVWLVGLLVASIRAGAGAALSLASKPVIPDPTATGLLTDAQTQRAPQPLSAEQIAQAVAAVKAEMTRDPEGDG
jgi:hypothetical protein